MVDRRPAAVVRCQNPSDVCRGIAFARRHELPLAVRGGGHNVAGNAVCDDGIMLDLSPMRHLHVHPERRTARAGPGLLLGDLDRGTQRFGLATPLGVMSRTGIAGLTLGGGLGWLNGRFGLACDNLLAAEVVTAEGELLRVDPEEHPDLFWALRGGGGNFGVVTSFLYRLHQVGPVLAGALGYPWAAARDVLRAHDEFLATAPDELSTAVSLALDPAGRRGRHRRVLVRGSGGGRRVLAPLRAAAPRRSTPWGRASYVAWQRGPDPGFPAGRLHYWKSGYLLSTTEAVLDVLLGFRGDDAAGGTGIGLQRLHGAAARVPPDATAFPHRRDQYDLLALAQWQDPAATAANVAWVRELYAALRPHLQDAVYVNNLGAEDADRVHAAYGPNHARLAEVKRTWDPANVFRLNQNIDPDR